jgi:hypothetical protein
LGGYTLTNPTAFVLRYTACIIFAGGQLDPLFDQRGDDVIEREALMFLPVYREKARLEANKPMGVTTPRTAAVAEAAGS